ncbi:hypothetical protein LCGC14_1456880 [marine sediment metagenome]|uniref:DUF551 domain-containing protein n=1 Tax=marine sediment metagenome TaxID=412755 RepID=A0A0F9JH03_9ZZZZ
MEWISVEETHPSRNTEVLLYVAKYNRTLIGNYGKNNRGEWGYFAEYTPIQSVTHWMPLPEAPK